VGEPDADVGEPDADVEPDIDECAVDNGGCGDALIYRCVDQVRAAPTCEQVLAAGSLYPAFGTQGLADFGPLSTNPLYAGLRPYSIATLTDDSIVLVGDARSVAGGEPACSVQRIDQGG